MKITFEEIGVENFRDLGGLTTTDGRTIKTGLVFRSACPVDAKPEVLKQLNIRTIVDFRSKAEATAVPHTYTDAEIIPMPVLAGSRPELMNDLNTGRISPSGARELMLDIYTCQIVQSSMIFGRFLKLFTEASNLPLLFHCTAGKDRTGHATALLLSLLGVPWEANLDNYLETNLHLNRMCSDIQEQLFAEVSHEAVKAIMMADADYLTAARKTIFKLHGSVKNYLLGPCHLTEDDISRIRENLLD